MNDAAFSSSFSRFSCQALVANKCLSGFAVRFRTLFGLALLTKFDQILPNFTKFDQKRAAKGLERGSKQGFSESDLFKSCQVCSLMSSSNRRRLLLKPSRTARRCPVSRIQPGRGRGCEGYLGGPSEFLRERPSGRPFQVWSSDSNLADRSIDSKGVDFQTREENSERLAQSKGLASSVSAEL